MSGRSTTRAFRDEAAVLSPFTLPQTSSTGQERQKLPMLPREIRQRAYELSFRLLPTQRNVLIRAISSEVLGIEQPYVPVSPEEEQVAQTLASSEFGVLRPEVVGYICTYTPTAVGRTIVRFYLDGFIVGKQDNGSFVYRGPLW